MRRLRAIRCWGSALAVLIVALYFFIWPACTVLRCMGAPGLKSGEIPRFVFGWHKHLTDRYERWAKDRVTSGQAASVDVGDISGTEWPVFGSVFYLMATAALQDAHEAGKGGKGGSPADYARGAVEAATALVADPGHARWVREKWGGSYLQRENVFYRMLHIMAFTCHARLLQDERYVPDLRAQVHGLAAELRESPHFLLDDYPGECYPSDVLWAVASIRRADPILGTNHSDLARDAMKHFDGPLLTAHGVPPYSADSGTGRPGAARGCPSSAILTFAPELDTDAAWRWYDSYVRAFWQERLGAVGFREFPAAEESEWYFDVDAGPVVFGYGTAASAFGCGAARAVGRLDHAYALGAQMVAASWPLPDGTLLFPRWLSNATDAPYLGEAAVLFLLTRTPSGTPRAGRGPETPAIVWVLVLLGLALGAALVLGEWRRLRRALKQRAPCTPAREGIAFALWAVLLLACVLSAAAGQVLASLVCFGAWYLLPGRVAGGVEASSGPSARRS
ncbi:MAG: hypothetical protein ACYTFZ_00970 [Planctomycetota bacterium]|jgi:hypothetical protein